MKKKRAKLSHWQLSSFFARIRYGTINSKLMNVAALYWILFMGNKNEQAQKHIGSVRDGIPIVENSFRGVLMDFFGTKGFMGINVIRVEEGITLSFPPGVFPRELVLETLRGAVTMAEALEDPWFKKEEETLNGSSN